MKYLKLSCKLMVFCLALFVNSSCEDALSEPLQNQVLQSNTDYTKTENMFSLLTGSYALLYDMQWENFPLISVRGDDVNAAGDQVPLIQTDNFSYDATFWMYNSVWQNLYDDIFKFYAAVEETEKYQKFAANPSIGDQYKAEVKVMIGFELFQLSRLWGGLLIPTTSQSQDLYKTKLSTFEEVMKHISNLMDEAIPLLPNVRPNQRKDVTGGVTRHTALAVKALANLELKNYQAVADATAQIISSNAFSLEADYYSLFKKSGKLNSENLLELQYSDFGQSSGENKSYLYAFFGPNAWTPAVQGASSGWGFWEPTLKYIKFMIDRGEQARLETSVLFTQNGIDILKSDPKYATLPSIISNKTKSNDIIGVTDGSPEARAKFSSGKHYLPSNELTPGRTDYGTGKNFICIRYAEVLLMHAEALTQGATSSSITAVQAVNLVRARAGLGALATVTLDDVLNEKYAELAMEWGTRFYDLVRHNKTTELNEGGRTYTDGKRFIAYPQAQVDILLQLKK